MLRRWYSQALFKNFQGRYQQCHLLSNKPEPMLIQIIELQQKLMIVSANNNNEQMTVTRKLIILSCPDNIKTSMRVDYEGGFTDPIQEAFPRTPDIGAELGRLEHRSDTPKVGGSIPSAPTLPFSMNQSGRCPDIFINLK